MHARLVQMMVIVVVAGCSSRSSSSTKETPTPARVAPTNEASSAAADVPTDEVVHGTAREAPAPSPPQAATTSAFAGSYRGAIEGTPATLTLAREGERITGTIDAAGYRYEVTGTVAGSRATGTLSDPQAGGGMPFEATSAGGDLRFVVSGTGTNLTIEFRGANAAPAPVPPPAAAAPRAPSSPATEQPRDARLVGAWGYTEQLGDAQSGFGLIRWELVVRPDGTYTYGNASSQTNGRWRTRGNVVEVSDDGASWAVFARYTTDGRQLLFTLGDGSRQLWRRQ